MGMGFAPTWLHQVSPLLHTTTLTTERKCHFRGSKHTLTPSIYFQEGSGPQTPEIYAPERI